VASPRSILVVEDEYILAMSLSNVLKGAGYRVIGPASSVRAAKDLLLRRSPAGAILDVMLRGDTVLPLAQLLDDQLVPILVISGCCERRTLPPVLALAPYLAKPFQESALSQLARCVFGRPVD